MKLYKILTVISLIIAVLALTFSIYLYTDFNNKMEKTSSAIEEINENIDKFRPLLPDIEVISKMMDRLETLLLGTPSITPNE